MGDQTLLNVLRLGVVVWLFAWCVRVARDFARGRVTTVSITILIHFIFVGVPLALDAAGNLPDHRAWPNYRYAWEDEQTNLIFWFYVAICPPLWWYTTRREQGPSGVRAVLLDAEQRFLRYARRLRPLLWLCLLSPLVLLFFAPDPAAYLDYAVIVRERFGVESRAYHQYISTATTLAVLAAAALVYASKHVWPSLVGLSPFVLFAVWLNGKRACVVVWLMLVLIVLRMRGQLRGGRLILASGVAAVVFLAYSFSYQFSYRTYTVETTQAAYQSFRIDFGRDNGIRLAIYGELHPEYVQILEYRGQSLLFNLVFFVPRSIWPEKPWPYAVYSTAAVFNLRRDYLGWGVTTSWMEESIANFGWLGLLLGPLLITLVIRIGDSTGEPVASFLTKLVATLLLTVHMAAWIYLAPLWVVAVWRARRISRRDEALTRSGSQRRFPALPRGAATRPAWLARPSGGLHPRWVSREDR